jgi:hypothetical protein
MSKLVTLPTWHFKSPLIYSPHELLELFRFNASPRNTIKYIAKVSNLDPPKVSDRTMDNLSGKGVTEKTLFRAVAPLLEVAPKGLMDEIDQIWNEGNSQARAIWLSNIASFECNLGDNAFDLEGLGLFKTFIFERVSYIEQIDEWVESIGGRGELKTGKHPVNLITLILERTNLLVEHQTALIEGMKKYIDGCDSEDHQINVAICHLNADFPLALFALLDQISLDRKYQHNPEQRVPSFLAQILDMDARCYFGKLIKFIKKRTGHTSSFLASLIPVPQMNELSGRTEHEIQKERLKEWVSGKSRPSNETLQTFMCAFKPEDQFAIFAYSHICLAIDELVAASEHKDILRGLVFTKKNYQRYV